MKSKRVWLWIIFLASLVLVPAISSLPMWEDEEFASEEFVPSQINTIRMSLSGICTRLIQDSALYKEGWDSLRPPNFWRFAMKFPPDTVVVNIAKTREIVEVLSLKEVRAWPEKRKKRYEDSLRTAYKQGKKGEIFFTSGRNHFYQFSKVLPEIDKAIALFQDEGTDPWYAQTILLIESPGRLQFSTEGAYGAFQLMEGVARDVGLIVNDSIDERTEFDKSARGAARLIQRICIPKARALCKQYKLNYREHDIWFRLLVMHVYHAGIGNVRRVFRKMRPKEGGIPLITKLWQTKGRRFGNASQNYSQIALSALLELDDLVEQEGIICPLDQQEDGSFQEGHIR